MSLTIRARQDVTLFTFKDKAPLELVALLATVNPLAVEPPSVITFVIPSQVFHNLVDPLRPLEVSCQISKVVVSSVNLSSTFKQAMLVPLHTGTGLPACTADVAELKATSATSE